MTSTKDKPATAAIKDLLSHNTDGLREIVRAVMQEMLEAEMTDALQAAKSERTASRLGYRAGYYSRTLVTRVGKLELRVPQDRNGRFSPELFERYQRSEQALVATLAEMYVQGVSTRKVKAITEELCDHSFSASAINKRLDDSLAQFASRRLEEPFPYLILDARYEKVREGGIVASQAVLIAVGIDWDGRRQILGVEMAHREASPRGARFCSACGSAGSQAWSWWWPMIMRVCGRRSARCCPRLSRVPSECSIQDLLHS
jgi:transposase-like protein